MVQLLVIWLEVTGPNHSVGCLAHHIGNIVSSANYSSSQYLLISYHVLNIVLLHSFLLQSKKITMICHVNIRDTASIYELYVKDLCVFIPFSSISGNRAEFSFIRLTLKVTSF